MCIRDRDTNMDITEIVGTGGDKSNSFNISTTSAFVAAATGVKVAKHGKMCIRDRDYSCRSYKRM